MSFTGGGGHPALAVASGRVVNEDLEVRDVGAVSLSPRQRELDRRWGYYRCEQYAARSVAWDGSRAVGQFERDAIALAGYVPPGFYVAHSETLPIQFRKPSTPYHLCKVIVDRFTGLLFGQKRHPQVTVKGDEQTEDYVNAVIEAGRLWPQMMLARTFGGATGTAVVGFKVLAGRPSFEVFDPRWCAPTFLDRANLILRALEYRHTFKQEVRDQETGEWVEADFWYRRVIDVEQDVVFEPILADPRIRNPEWTPATVVRHGLGFCPVAWMQNQAVVTDVDGDPDCQGVYELVEAIDRLNAQGEKGILANCDPTTVITTDAQMGEVRKGSANAIKLPNGGSAGYMEMSGGGIVQAREQAKIYKEMALEVAQCVLEQPDGGNRTATEVERNFAAMLARADTFREQYGEMGVKRLINMALVAAVSLSRPRNVDGKITRFSITLPKKEDGGEHALGKGPYQATLTWPPYFEPSLDDVGKAVSASAMAKQTGLIDQAHATKFIAPFFQVEDPSELAGKVQGEDRAKQDEIEAEILAGAPTDPAAAEAPKKEQDTALNGAQVTAMSEIIKDTASGILPISAARELLIFAFNVPEASADKMLSDLRGAIPKSAAVARRPPGELAEEEPEAPPAEEPPA